MFATIEEKLIIGMLAAVAILVGVLGFIHHERSEGAAVCVQQDHSAADAQHKKETDDAKNTISDLRLKLDALATAPPVAAPMRLCVQARSVPSRPAATGAKPADRTDSGSGGSVQVGTESSVDIGPGVQDIALASMLCSAKFKELWNLNVKEASP